MRRKVDGMFGLLLFLLVFNLIAASLQINDVSTPQMVAVNLGIAGFIAITILYFYVIKRK